MSAFDSFLALCIVLTAGVAVYVLSVESLAGGIFTGIFFGVLCGLWIILRSNL